ncbi:cation:proton antiporter regulatory subunit [Halobium salinum]|uniref:Cation:proton antiporter regulatory subunit n=1 Tax=Halobium salinum TaxID=1364940 RepID=A0ABD5PI31_9EURY|nr:TrkA C-terminal domain-containing protein [Halobium salinum]
MKVRETQLPGVGTRYQVSFAESGVFTLLLHNDGDREAFWSEDEDSDSERLFKTTESQARKLAEIFDGTYFEPVPEDLENVFQDARIRWIAVPVNSPLAGKTIREGKIRTQTNASIIGIQRETTTVSNPSPDTQIRADDVLVVVGSEDAFETLEELVTG